MCVYVFVCVLYNISTYSNNYLCTTNRAYQLSALGILCPKNSVMLIPPAIISRMLVLYLVLQYHAIPKRRFLEIGLPKSPWVEKICFNTIQTGHKWSNFG